MNEFRQDERPEEIEREIEETRERMSHNIDALGERLSPRHLKEQAKEAITDKARETGSRLSEAFRDNAVPVTMVGIGVTWMLLKRRGNNGWSEYGSSTGGGIYRGRERRMMPYGGSSQTFGHDYMEEGGRAGIREKVANAAGRVGEKVSDAASTVGEKVSGAASSVADTTGNLARRAGDFGTSAKQRATDLGRRARGTAENQIEDNPLAVAAVAAAFGLALGFLLPGTERENRVMGETRDRVVDTAKETARTVKDVATERARSEASDVMPEIKETAREVVDTVKESAGRVAQETKQAAKETAKSGGKSSGGTARNV